MAVILVTGGTGSLGREVVRRMVGGSQQIRILTRQTNVQMEGVEIFRSDLTATPALHDAVKGADTIVHCASNSKDTQTAGTLREHAHWWMPRFPAGSPHFIYVSIVGVERSAGYPLLSRQARG